MKMKKIVSTVALSALCICQSPSPANAYAFVCTNCSTNLQQALEYAAQLKELAELVTQTKEAIKQTEMQIKNLERIPENLKDNPLNWLTSLAEKTAQLNTYRADENLLAQIFNELYPEQSEFASLAQACGRSEIEAANKKYQEHYDTWSKKIDEATMATFQLTGRQLQDMAESGELRDYLDNLLSKPEGHMQALEAGNQLAALQIEEIRQFRELAATQAQAEAIRGMKQEKQDQMAEERWRKMTNTDKLTNESGSKNAASISLKR